MATKEEKKYKRISATITAVLMLLLLVVCLSFGYMPPDPPIPESGVEVNLGYSDQGFGETQQESDATSTSQPATQPSPTQEEVSTQNTEESVSIPDKVTPKNIQQNSPKEVQESPKQEEKPKEPELNQKALFSNKKSASKSSEGGSQGVTSGEGNMGKENGNPNATGYSGVGGNGSAGGPNYSLAGRKALSLPEPDYKSNRQGRIVIAIQVDKQGNVIAAEKERGTTIDDSKLVSQAIAAARRAKFSASSEAAEKQKGTITYVFSRVN